MGVTNDEEGLRDLWIRMPAVMNSGLTERELGDLESRFEFEFPADLRMLLNYRLPVGDRSPAWRGGRRARKSLARSLSWPLEGLLFDVRENDTWLPEWGARPDRLRDAERIATQHVEAAPPLIPIYSHRYLPARPTATGNPVFSVYQTDIIVYGEDLFAYLLNEFVRGHQQPEAPVRQIEFWSHWVDYE